MSPTAPLTSRTLARQVPNAPTHFLSLADWTRPRLEEVLRLATAVKQYPHQYTRSLEGRVLLMLFQKPSLRTRVSFESAMARLGGHAIDFDLAATPWGQGRETPADTARTVSRYVDGILARLFSHAELLDLATHATVPVINGMTDLEHPCQALGDLLTLQEAFGRLDDLHLAYLGDANNNVTHSLLDACSKMGIHLSIGCPAGPEFQPDPGYLARALRSAAATGSRIQIVHDPRQAVEGVNAVYTDNWTGYSIPAEQRESRQHSLIPFQVTAELMKQARPDAVFMHGLPAWRGQELESEVIDGPQSIVFAQTENRLHTEKALLMTLIR
jgi:ornithine carbamoyltransferase